MTSDYNKRQQEIHSEWKKEQYLAAHRHLRDHYGDYGLSEEDRDEVMGALGIMTEEQAVRTPGLSVGRVLTRQGLSASRRPEVAPPSAPCRGQ